jgi:hypothetical protein
MDMDMDMDIVLTKLTNDRHRLEIVRGDGSREAATLETRSYLLHDLLHLAVETTAGIESGFWGLLARGRTLNDMNDRSGQAMGDASAELLVVEQIVGVLTSAAKGAPAADVLAALVRWTEAEGRALPAWLDESFIPRSRACLRAFLGHWRATPHGETMTLRWTEPRKPFPQGDADASSERR